MPLDRKIYTSPPSNTTFAFAQQETQEEITFLWQNVVLQLAVGNTGDALTATATPPLTSYTDAKYFMVVAPSTNTGAMSLSIDGLAPLPLRSSSNAPLSAGDIVAGQALFLYYDSANAVFRNMSGAGGAALPNPTQQHQMLKADASLNWVPSQEIFSGNF